MPEPKGKLYQFPKKNLPDRRVASGYTFQGSGRTAPETRSIFSGADVAGDLEMETQTEQYDDVAAHLDEIDFKLQEDRVFSPHELQQLEHVLMRAKRKLEGMRRNPMVTNQLVRSIEVKYDMLRELLNEHYKGNESDSVHVIEPRKPGKLAA